MVKYQKRKVLMKFFYPDVYIKSAYELDGEYLSSLGIKVVIFDIDNTLVPYSVQDMPEKTEEFLAHLEENGITPCFVSNNGKERVERFNGGKRFALYKGGKPSKKAALKVAKHFGVQANNIAVVGDQIFTDICFGKNAGAMTVLCPPIDPKNEPWYFVFKRLGEKIILYFYGKRKNK